MAKALFGSSTSLPKGRLECKLLEFVQKERTIMGRTVITKVVK